MGNITLGELIKQAREKIGMSQRELSRQSGIDNNTIAKLEKGERKKPNIFALKKLAFILKIDLETMLKVAGYSKEDIEFELNTLGNSIAIPAEGDQPLMLISEISQTKDEDLLTRKAICELIKKCNVDDLDIVKKLSTKKKKIIARGFEIFINNTKRYEQKLKEEKKNKINLNIKSIKFK